VVERFVDIEKAAGPIPATRTYNNYVAALSGLKANVFAFNGYLRVPMQEGQALISRKSAYDAQAY
jgi:hypothetical protein